MRLDAAVGRAMTKRGSAARRERRVKLERQIAMDGKHAGFLPMSTIREAERKDRVMRKVHREQFARSFPGAPIPAEWQPRKPTPKKGSVVGAASASDSAQSSAVWTRAPASGSAQSSVASRASASGSAQSTVISPAAAAEEDVFGPEDFVMSPISEMSEITEETIADYHERLLE